MPGTRNRGWLAWFAVVFVWFNLGLTHAAWHANVRAPGAGRLRHPLRELRSSLTNDGDVLRYFAYCNAILGRAHSAYYVRDAAAWQSENQANLASVDPDTHGQQGGPPLEPYRDFQVEYPPGFFLWALPPALLTTDGDTYRLLFGAWMGLLLTAAIMLCARMAPSGERTRLPGMAAVAALALGVVVAHRYDAAVSLLLCVACFATVTRRPALAGGAFGLAVATKIVPLVAVPVVALALLRERRFRELWIQAGAALLSVGVVVGGAFALWGPGVLEMTRYHRDRPFEVESTWAGVLGLLMPIYPAAVHVGHSFGSSNLEGPWVQALLPLSTPVLVLALVAVYAHTWISLARPRRADDGTHPLLAGVAATLAVYMVAGKVFSPQYLVWLLPLGLVASGGRSRALLLALLLLTQVLYPYLFFWVQTASPLSSLLVLLRNGMLAYWAYRIQRDPAAAGFAPPR